MDAVFHTAAKVDMWGTRQEFFDINVSGTINVISACRECGIKHLIFTSSASVVFDGKDLEGKDEALPYPVKGESHYAHTKMLAEKHVLEASSDTLKTIALRPHLIYGQGDTQLIPKIIEKAKSGRIRRIGKKHCLIDTTHIRNFTNAQILSYEKLLAGAPVDGKPYFITNGKPVETWEFINGILKDHNLPLVERTIPRWLALTIAAFSETISRVTGKPPFLTRFLVKEISTSHWFNIDAAKRDLQLLNQPVQNRNQ
jgi:nucleoside-diphosphate-sugar epimerase